MRKRIAIAVLAIIGATLLVYVISQPRKGSIEWHKREFVAAANRPSMSESVHRTILRLRGKGFSYGISGERLARMRHHEAALIELGFLEKRDFVLNLADMPPYAYIRNSLYTPSHDRIPDDRVVFTRMEVTGAHVLTIVAVRQDMDVWEELIHNFERIEKADESGK